MDIENLLNPAGETPILTETSDEDIFQSVMEPSKHVRTLKSMDVDNGVETEPQPTRLRCKVLKAVSIDYQQILLKYIDGLDDPVSHKIEGFLWLFNWKLRLNKAKKMKDTILTKYFWA